MERKKYLDLHTHTIYSDGVSTPEILVRTARLNGLDLVALTDHDMIAGLPKAIETGKKWDIQVIPGIEVSTSDYHILGLNIDYTRKSFQEFVKESSQEQEKVCNARIEVLRSKGIPMTLEKMKHYFPKSRLGKFNLCMAMIQDEECREYFKNREIRIGHDNYKLFLGGSEGEEIADKAMSITPERAIQEIHSTEGLAFIAHPFIDIKNMSELDELVKHGLDGLEIQPHYNGRNEPFREYAKQKNLLITYGSDWHGGLFGKQMLDDRGNNLLYEELAKKLRII